MLPRDFVKDNPKDSVVKAYNNPAVMLGAVYQKLHRRGTLAHINECMGQESKPRNLLIDGIDKILNDPEHPMTNSPELKRIRRGLGKVCGRLDCIHDDQMATLLQIIADEVNAKLKVFPGKHVNIADLSKRYWQVAQSTIIVDLDDADKTLKPDVTIIGPRLMIFVHLVHVVLLNTIWAEDSEQLSESDQAAAISYIGCVANAIYSK